MSSLLQPEKKSIEQHQNQQLEDFFAYTRKSKCSNSIRTYQFAWTKFKEWQAEHGYDFIKPPASSHELLIGLFISSMAKGRHLKPASLSTYLAGIKHFYSEHGINVDTRHQEVRKAMSGIRREMGTRQIRKTPLLTENIKLLIDSIGKQEIPINIRDKAIILIGFTGAFRRSELVGIDIENLSFDLQGVSILIPNSKTDQEGAGRIVDIPFISNEQYCPVRALKKWLSYSQVEKGPVFLQITKGGIIIPKRLGDRSVALRLKVRCKPFGFSHDISGHSLRAGHVTAAIKKGTQETWIMRQTGHTNISTLRKYERLNREFEANSAATIGL